MRRLLFGGKKRDKDETPPVQPKGDLVQVRPLREHAQPTSEKQPPARQSQHQLADDDSQQKRKGVAFAGIVQVDEPGKALGQRLADPNAACSLRVYLSLSISFCP
jgi:hypothetical protein